MGPPIDKLPTPICDVKPDKCPKTTVCGHPKLGILDVWNQSLTLQMDVGFLGSLDPVRDYGNLFESLEWNFRQPRPLDRLAAALLSEMTLRGHDGRNGLAGGQCRNEETHELWIIHLVYLDGCCHRRRLETPKHDRASLGA